MEDGQEQVFFAGKVGIESPLRGPRSVGNDVHRSPFRGTLPERPTERTPRGDQLLIELCRLLPPLDDAIGGSAFDPATSHQRFRVTATDYTAMALLGETVRMCRRSATNIFVEVVEWTDESYQLTSSGQCDLALGIGSASTVPNGLKVEVLCRQRFVCLINSDIRRPAKRFSLDDYLSRPHAVVDTAG